MNSHIISQKLTVHKFLRVIILKHKQLQKTQPKLTYVQCFKALFEAVDREQFMRDLSNLYEAFLAVCEHSTEKQKKYTKKGFLYGVQAKTNESDEDENFAQYFKDSTDLGDKYQIVFIEPPGGRDQIKKALKLEVPGFLKPKLTADKKGIYVIDNAIGELMDLVLAQAKKAYGELNGEVKAEECEPIEMDHGAMGYLLNVSPKVIYFINEYQEIEYSGSRDAQSNDADGNATDSRGQGNEEETAAAVGGDFAIKKAKFDRGRDYGNTAQPKTLARIPVGYPRIQDQPRAPIGAKRKNREGDLEDSVDDADEGDDVIKRPGMQKSGKLDLASEVDNLKRKRY